MKKWFLTKNKIYHNFSKLIDSKNFSNDSMSEFSNFMNDYSAQFLKKNLSPWSLVFYTRLNQKVDDNQFKEMIRETYKIIIKYKLPYTLNDTHVVHDREEPIMLNYIEWGGNLCINEDFFSLLTDLGFSFSFDQYNDILSFTQGLEVSQNWEYPNPKKWDFDQCYSVLKNFLGTDFLLNEDNTTYLLTRDNV